MKSITSFTSTLKLSRYMFRGFALIAWLLGLMMTVFYLQGELIKVESDIHQEFNQNYDEALKTFVGATHTLANLKYTVNHSLKEKKLGESDNVNIYPLAPQPDCLALTDNDKKALSGIKNSVVQWYLNYASNEDLTRAFIIEGKSSCVVDLLGRSKQRSTTEVKHVLHEMMAHFRDVKAPPMDARYYWVAKNSQRDDMGYLYMITPIYRDSQWLGMLGSEQIIHLSDFITADVKGVSVMMLDSYYKPSLHITDRGDLSLLKQPFDKTPILFAYTDDFSHLILKKQLNDSTLHMVYSVPLRTVLSSLQWPIFEAIILHILLAILLIIVVYLAEKKTFLPAEDNAERLEEQEQFNYTIINSAPVGISIIRLSDGESILYNTLAEGYLATISEDEKQRVIKEIQGQRSNAIDLKTREGKALQISYVKSRFRHENVALCIFMDVSSRAQVEETLQEMANAAEQTSQAKSMFLATVSHELRTPLFGIMGNLELLQSEAALPQGAERLISAMNNASSLLLKIINDILDFSKMESEQLSIESKPVSCLDLVANTAANYLPLVVKKNLALYCFVENSVPAVIYADPLRLQQILSNLLSNAIKFTDTGVIMLRVNANNGYVEFSVSDSGCGIPQQSIFSLFDPFYQVTNGDSQVFHGTGLGLAICEKLANMMDGDISVDSAPGIGSKFTVRLPMLNTMKPVIEINNQWKGKTLWLSIRNQFVLRYIQDILLPYGADMVEYHGQMLGAEDILISDHQLSESSYATSFNVTSLKAYISISSSHIGPSTQDESGQWLLSTARVRKIIPLIEGIYQGIDQQRVSEHTAISNESKYSRDNGDIKVMIVDDHPINRRLISDQLAFFGYSTFTANDGLDALNALKMQHADIILTDVNMPNLDGYGFTRALREQGMTIPMIGVTANALADEQQRCLESGMDACLSKPLSRDELEKTVGYYANLIREARE